MEPQPMTPRERLDAVRAAERKIVEAIENSGVSPVLGLEYSEYQGLVAALGFPDDVAQIASRNLQIRQELERIRPPRFGAMWRIRLNQNYVRRSG